MASHTNLLKIGLVLDDSLDSSDGVQQYILTVGEWLLQQGHEVHYLVGQTERTDIENIHSLSRNIKVRFNGNRMSVPLPASRRKLKSFLQHQKFDVLHVQVPYSPWLAHRIMLEAPANTAIVGTFHILPYGRLARTANRVLAAWTWRSRRQFDEMLSVSTAAAEYAQNIYGFQSIIVPNAINYQRFKKARPLTKNAAVPQILFLGRLVPRKGCLILLKAIALLHASDPQLPFRIMICGKGPLESQLRQYVIDQQLTDLVSFEGYVSENDKPSYYASAEIAVFPSSGGESFGIVLAEAMAAGRAVILAGDNPGYSAVLTEQPSLLFDPTDAQLLADKLAFYLTHPQQSQAMADWAASYSQRFDIATVGAQIQTIYYQALRKASQL